MKLDDAVIASDEIRGWLSRDEQRRLYELARAVPAGGTIVELGSWMGKSAVMLGAGSLAGPRARVFAVDLFAAVHEENLEYAPRLDDAPEDYLPVFHRNIERAALQDLVTPIRARTTDAAEDWEGGPIDLLFIDANHSYESTRADFLAWVGHCGRGSTCAFHDYTNQNETGVRQFVDELLLADVLRRPELCGSILHGCLALTDQAAIGERLKAGRRGLLKPSGYRSIHQLLAVGSGWRAFNRGDRRGAVREGFRSVSLKPLDESSWRLLACALIKPVGRTV